MTEENQRKLYKHFVATGQTERAQEILNVYPQFEGEVEVVEEPKEKKKKK